MICRSARYIFRQSQEMRCHGNSIFISFFLVITVGYYFYVGRALPAGVLLITDSDISSYMCGRIILNCHIKGVKLTPKMIKLT